MKIILIGFTFLSFIHLSYSQVVKVSSDFKVENYSANFEVESINNVDVLSLKVLGYKCSFQIRRITAPQQTRGRRGIISSNKSEDCLFRTKDKEVNIFFNQIELFDVSYRIEEDNKISGMIIMNTINKSYRIRF